MKKSICIVTGSRAEYGLLKPLMTEIKNVNTFRLQIIATCMHLSPEFGLTYKQIESDGFFINKKVEMLLSSDTPESTCKSIGLGMICFSDAYLALKPDLVILLGDRFEIFAAATAAFVCRIPVAHIHGGEVTEGAIDDAFRHCISKMSHIHFTSTKEHRKRVIQLGEEPKRVFNVGAIGLDNIKKIHLLGIKEIEKQLCFQFQKINFLITFHPSTLSEQSSGKEFGELISALNQFPQSLQIFTKTNADTNGRIINKMIDAYEKDNPGRVKSFVSLGTLRYLSLMKNVNAVIGNSSSGIVETPSMRVPTVDIGDRQKGRFKPSNIISCKPEKNDIIRSIEIVLSKKFTGKIKKISNPYGDGNTAKMITAKLKIILKKPLQRKSFYDL